MGLSLGQLASAVGRSSSSVRRWERGESAPSDDVLPELATALDLNEGELGEMVASVHAHHDGTEPKRPTPGGVEEDTATAAAIPRVKTTIEDDEVVVQVADYFETPAPAAPPQAQRQPSRYGRISSVVRGSRDSWIGWLRGLLTALALLFLFMGLVWAFGELLMALEDVLSSFSTGA